LSDPFRPGPVALLGSGETSPVGGRLFEALAARRGGAGPLRIAVLETPAGFEPNSAQVAGSVAEFLLRRLAGRRPAVEVVPARERGTAHSPDDPALLPPILRADLLFLGPGSPTYAVRQLSGSLAWQAVVARHRQGATTVLASAAVVAAGSLALPVYEIYKAGSPLHWAKGLDLFGSYGLSLVLVPHWNNRDGGEKLDTRRCYLGEARFGALRAMLPPGHVVVGVDENTALVLDPDEGTGEVHGEGGATVIREGRETRIGSSQRFGLSLLGDFDRAGGDRQPSPEILAAAPAEEGGAHPEVPPEVAALASAREEARIRKDWAAADALRERIASLGWRVADSPSGQIVLPEEPGGGRG
jgi:cyanophycinase-like exopeptidase